ncbi:GTP-binding protein [Leuconostoc gelidum]|uniref:GTP-binding protein n=1 Tax=Leuconostoc gelidum TaxID=1244 RepID=UPI001C7D4066|nr:GTP-binding protein [Leuconostoc gelidum]MBZ6009883.1 GTP-binding protein [Leuconostoc gelidum subsp. aenigmaticum]
MSFFNLFKKKNSDTATTEPEYAPNEPITWENTTVADDFFTGYLDAISQLENDEQTAAAETLRADEPTLQMAFIDRFAKHVQSETATIKDADERTAAIITAINTIRVHNKQMNITVRAHLAQTKKNLIGEQHEN